MAQPDLPPESPLAHARTAWRECLLQVFHHVADVQAAPAALQGAPTRVLSEEAFVALVDHCGLFSLLPAAHASALFRAAALDDAFLLGLPPTPAMSAWQFLPACDALLAAQAAVALSEEQQLARAVLSDLPPPPQRVSSAMLAEAQRSAAARLARALRSGALGPAAGAQVAEGEEVEAPLPPEMFPPGFPARLALVAKATSAPQVDATAAGDAEGEAGGGAAGLDGEAAEGEAGAAAVPAASASTAASAAAAASSRTPPSRRTAARSPAAPSPPAAARTPPRLAGRRGVPARSPAPARTSPPVRVQREPPVPQLQLPAVRGAGAVPAAATSRTPHKPAALPARTPHTAREAGQQRPVRPVAPTPPRRRVPTGVWQDVALSPRVRLQAQRATEVLCKEIVRRSQEAEQRGKAGAAGGGSGAAGGSAAQRFVALFNDGVAAMRQQRHAVALRSWQRALLLADGATPLKQLAALHANMGACALPGMLPVASPWHRRCGVPSAGPARGCGAQLRPGAAAAAHGH